jgi:hypothetical protein
MVSFFLYNPVGVSWWEGRHVGQLYSKRSPGTHGHVLLEQNTLLGLFHHGTVAYSQALDGKWMSCTEGHISSVKWQQPLSSII